LFYYFLTRWSLRNIELKNQSLSNKSVFFSSYFFNLDSKLAKQGVYHSRQWGELPAFINRYGKKTVHLENFIKSPEIPDPSIAKRMLKSFNQNNTQSFHIFLDGYLSLNILTKVITHYFKLNRRIIDYKIIKEAFNVKDSKLNLWPLLKDDWFCSTTGKTSVANLILINLFEKHLNELSFQKAGFYLCENQGWERALIKAWRNNKHGRLIAVPHSTIRFWDLRYFSDPRVNSSPSKYNLPTPDNYALNGEMALKSFIQNNYPKKNLLKVEALRYQFLASNIIRELPKKPISKIDNKVIKRILILGDFTEQQTDLMLKDLESITKKYTFTAKYTLKPHPVSQIKTSYYPLLNLEITKKPLEDIVKDFDIVFASNTTTASLDCFLMRKKVVIFLDSNNLNFSPLRNVDGVEFVSNLDELYLAIKNEIDFAGKVEKSNFFWIDLEMQKWKKIISEITS
jgi:surface carbohydrate biosynthesis protein (TIGR04326 family)